MASSLSPECTPLKHEYDSCFNSWFEGYLEPAISSSATTEQRAAYSKQKADEFDRNCGKIWEQYKTCIHRAVNEKGLGVLLDEARAENPLTKPPSDT